jgi:hypothetical protein
MKIEINNGEEGGMEELLNGQYLVTDPCYVIRDDSAWSKFCKKLFEGGDTENNWLLVDGELVYAWGTADGDGSYPVYVNGELSGEACVDSGTLAFVPMGLVKKINPGLARSVLASEDSAGVLVLVKEVEPDLSHGDVQAGAVEVYTSAENPYVQAEEERERVEREAMVEADDSDDDCREHLEREQENWNRDDIA